jgi:fatty-acyl-CoA synthase
MVEYFNDPRATLAVFTADGFLRTGDLGFTRLDGGFVFQSRMGDVLRLGGYLVSPREIEEHLNGHPSVASSQVVGVRIEQKLRAVAFVKMQPGAACAESFLVAHCKQALAGFKVPFRIFSVEEFPTTEGPNGRKVQKHQLRELAQRWCS